MQTPVFSTLNPVGLPVSQLLHDSVEAVSLIGKAERAWSRSHTREALFDAAACVHRFCTALIFNFAPHKIILARHGTISKERLNRLMVLNTCTRKELTNVTIGSATETFTA